MKAAGQSGTPGVKGPGTGLAPNIASLLCYICMPFPALVFLVLEKENRDVRFHAWQGTLAGVTFIAALIVIELMQAIFGWVMPFLGGLVGIFSYVALLAYLIGFVVGASKAYQGERWKIPVIGDIAAQKAGV